MTTSLAMTPDGVTHGLQWRARTTLPCYRCHERTQWRYNDLALCLACGHPLSHVKA